MIIKPIHIISIGFFLLLISCVDNYWPELDDQYQDLLVVDGKITNAPGPYTIRLSKSTSVDHPEYTPLAGYETIISDNLGNSEMLSEIEPGVYQTAIDGIQGIIGRDYSVTIQSPDGKTYLSDFERLNDPVGIDSVFFELEYDEVDYFPYDMTGYQFYLNTQPAPDNVTYFLWQLEQTYEYHADFLIYF